MSKITLGKILLSIAGAGMAGIVLLIFVYFIAGFFIYKKIIKPTLPPDTDTGL